MIKRLLCAPVGSNLLRPLIRAVHRVCPAPRVVVEGLRRANVVKVRQHVFGRLRHTVERLDFIECAVKPALSRRTVVSRDVDEQR